MNGLTRYAIPIALLTGTGVFILAFLVLRGTHLSPLVAIIIPAVLFVIVTAVVWFVVDGRTSKQAQLDAYRLEAEAKAHAALAQVSTIRKFVGQIKSPQVAQLLTQTCDDAVQLFDRIRSGNPNSLTSSATIMLEHLKALQGMLQQYVDIQDHPRFHDNGAEKLAQAQQAIAGFDQFLVNSIRLIEKGENVTFEVDLKQLDATRFDALN